MLYDYILENYEKDEPIFLEELPGRSKDSIRQEMKHLTDEGKLERLYNGVYYISYVSILGTKGKVSIEKYVDKKFLNVKGLVSGYFLGFNLFLLICNLLGVAEPPYWLNVFFAAGFAFVLAMIYMIIALILHGI